MKNIAILSSFLVLFTGGLIQGCGESNTENDYSISHNNQPADIPENMHIVAPIHISNTNLMNNRPSNAVQRHAAEELSIGRGNFFSYALPPGWRVGEDGQFALTLVSADNRALTVMVGNSGLMPGYNPGRFVYEKLMAMQPRNLSISEPVRAIPVHGFQEAWQFQVSYMLPGGHYVGEAVCHITNYYGGCVMAMTAAISEQSQWTSYASWLPQVSRQISALNGAAFGMRGVMQQNLQNSIAFGEAMKAYRSWSNEKWQEVTDDRNKSTDRQNYQFRENLGGINTYTNPYSNNTPVELSSQYKYYWMDQQGRVAGTNDPSVNPNHGGTGEWKQLERKENPY
ncbi:MAG: hypothetical protein QM802_18610 [Agriterribacter sp.]